MILSSKVHQASGDILIYPRVNLWLLQHRPTTSPSPKTSAAYKTADLSIKNQGEKAN